MVAQSKETSGIYGIGRVYDGNWIYIFGRIIVGNRRVHGTGPLVAPTVETFGVYIPDRGTEGNLCVFRCIHISE